MYVCFSAVLMPTLIAIIILIAEDDVYFAFVLTLCIHVEGAVFLLSRRRFLPHFTCMISQPMSRTLHANIHIYKLIQTTLTRNTTWMCRCAWMFSHLSFAPLSLFSLFFSCTLVRFGAVWKSLLNCVHSRYIQKLTLEKNDKLFESFLTKAIMWKEHRPSNTSLQNWHRFEIQRQNAHRHQRVFSLLSASSCSLFSSLCRTDLSTLQIHSLLL